MPASCPRGCSDSRRACARHPQRRRTGPGRAALARHLSAPAGHERGDGDPPLRLWDALTFTNDELHAKLEADLGADDGGIDYLPFSNVEQSVRDDVSFLKDSALIAGDVPIRGFLDENTGRLTEIS